MKLNRFDPEKYFVLNPASAITISLVFWVYLIFRAWFVPFLHDEIMTFWFYVESGNYIPFLYDTDFNAANNHVLNTFLTRSFYLFFGNDPFVLRLGGLLFIPIFCFYAYKIADLLKSKTQGLILFLSILFIHSIIEFFALSRGYGMSFALLLGAIWYLIRYIEKAGTRQLLLSLLFVFLMLSANLSLMSTALLILGLMILRSFFSGGRKNVTLLHSFWILLFGLVPLYFFMKYSFILQECNALYYGSHEGFWKVTVTSLVNAFFGEPSLFLRWVFVFYFIIIVVMSLLFSIKHFSFKLFCNKTIVFPVLLFGNIVAILLLDYFFNVNFPEDRAAFYLYFLFIGSFFFLAEELYKRLNKVLLVFIFSFLAIPLHFITAINFTHISVYRQDRIPNRFYYMLKEKTEKMNEIATLGSYKGRILVLAYRNYLMEGNVAFTHYNDYPSLIQDFQIVDLKENLEWKRYYNELDYDPVSGYSLLERKNKLKRTAVFTFDSISPVRDYRDEFYSLAEGSIDTLARYPLFFEYSMKLKSEKSPFRIWLVVSVSDALGKDIAYEYFALDWFRADWSSAAVSFYNGQLLTNLPPNSVRFKTYLWNINKASFSVSDAKVTIKKIMKDF